MEDIIIKECTNQELSQSEKLKLEMWLSESAENRKVYAQMRLALLYPGPARREKLQEEVWAGLKDRLKPHTAVVSRPFVLGYTWVRVAAILIVCLSLAFILYQVGGTYNREPSVVEVKVIEKVSLPGQKIRTRLPDGTLVELNADSRILVPASFKDNIREVTLYGEAFFDVARDESRPFIINTKDIRVEVLGTSFNVRSYPGGDPSVVAVASGKVAVSDDQQDAGKVNLVRGEKVAYKPKEKRMEKGSYNWEEEFGWKENILLFQGNDLSEIMEKLSRWYGVEFTVENSALKLNKKFSGRYKDASLKTVLEGLSFVYGFGYQIDNKTVTLK